MRGWCRRRMRAAWALCRGPCHVVARWVSTSTSSYPLQQLQRMQSLISQCGQAPTSDAKQQVLRQFHDMEPLLHTLYIQARPFHMTSESLLKYLTNPARPLLPPTSAIPPSIEALLDTLARGEVRGHAAKQLVHTFLDRHGIAICTSVPDPLSTFDVFLRCLDRRLRMGVSASTLRRVWTTEDRSSTALLQALDTDQRVSWPLPIALAQTWTGPGLPPTSTHWYASRKHDGVRCLALVRLTHGVVTHVDLVSRTGRVLTTLSAVATSLQQDLQQAGVAAWGEERAFVLDGELCALDDAGQESFVLAASQVQRPTELATLVYYPFDLLPLEAWLAWRTSPTPPFAERYARLQQMLEAVSKACPTTCLRRLPHVRLTSEGDWTSIQHRAAVEGWEGLMLRDDVPFQGRRTPSLRKVRRREEAEFVVEDIDVTTMRLPVDGTYADRVALASILISHHGRRVHVGSGFRVAQRLYYAAHPDDIVGHTVTVSYFEEAANLDGALPSLRFPVVKYVYDRGARPF